MTALETSILSHPFAVLLYPPSNKLPAEGTAQHDRRPYWCNTVNAWHHNSHRYSFREMGASARRYQRYLPGCRVRSRVLAPVTSAGCAQGVRRRRRSERPERRPAAYRGGRLRRNTPQLGPRIQRAPAHVPRLVLSKTFHSGTQVGKSK